MQEALASEGPNKKKLNSPTKAVTSDQQNDEIEEKEKVPISFKQGAALVVLQTNRGFLTELVSDLFDFLKDHYILGESVEFSEDKKRSYTYLLKTYILVTRYPKAKKLFYLPI